MTETAASLMATMTTGLGTFGVWPIVVVSVVVGLIVYFSTRLAKKNR